MERWLAAIATGEPFDMVISIKGRDGEYRPFLTRAEPLKEGGRVVRWFGTNTDITDLKRAQEALKEQQRTHRIVADNTYDFEFWRAHGRYLYVSPSSERVCGHKPADFEADSTLLDRLVHPDDRAGFREQMQTLTVSPSCVEFEFRIVHRDGMSRWLAQACQPVYGEQGEYLGLRGSNRESRSGRERNRRCERLTVVRTNSWRPWPTNSATPWPRSATPCKSCGSPPTRRFMSKPTRSCSGNWSRLCASLMICSM
jgi:PAS domain S-box-containing protein